MELRAVKAFYSAREGLVELDDDVLSIVRSVRELYGNRISIHHEPTTGAFVFVENCEDGVERLVFVCDELDARALDRLQSADSRSRGYVDTYEQAEREQDEAQSQLSEADRTKIHGIGEQIAHGLRKDGAPSPLPLKVAVPRSLHDA